MKALKYLSVIVAGIFIIAGCQKELSFESGFSGGRGKGSLLSAGGDCQPIIVGGYYLKDSTLNDSNYVIINLNITNPGTYNIFTETKNGFSFSDSGFFITTGPQSLKLKATGKPTTIQKTLFTVTFDTSICSFSVDVTDSIIKNAEYTYSKDSTGACTGAIAQGTYKVGVPLNSSNKVDVNINVNNPGRYTIVTDTIGGIYFKASGIVFGTGSQTIIFNGYGTPNASSPGTQVFTILNHNGTSSCGFKLDVDTGTIVNPPPGTAADSAWSFNQGALFFHGPVDTAFLVASPLGGSILTITGTKYPGADTALTMLITMPGSTVQTGTYTTSGGLTNAFSFDDTGGSSIYSANFGTPGAVMTMVITSYDNTTKIVKGTFSGNVEDASSNVVPITNGKFEAKVE